MIAGFLAFLRRDARATMAIAYLALLVIVAFAAPWRFLESRMAQRRSLAAAPSAMYKYACSKSATKCCPCCAGTPRA